MAIIAEWEPGEGEDYTGLSDAQIKSKKAHAAKEAGKKARAAENGADLLESLTLDEQGGFYFYSGPLPGVAQTLYPLQYPDQTWIDEQGRLCIDAGAVAAKIAKIVGLRKWRSNYDNFLWSQGSRGQEFLGDDTHPGRPSRR